MGERPLPDACQLLEAMKVSRKSFPKDELAAESKGRSLHIFTHRSKIIASVHNGKEHTAWHEFTFDQLCNLLERLAHGIERDVD